MGTALAGPPPPPKSTQPPKLHEDEELRERAGKRQWELETERAGLRGWRTLLLIACFLAPILAWICLYREPDPKGIGVAAFIEAFLLVTLLAVRTRLLTIRTELQRVEYETLLVSLEGLQERTAANLFFKHQFELKQYYDQALRQHHQAFALGVTCVLFGLGVVTAAIIVAGGNPTGNADVVIAILGAVGALLSGAVASIYLAMYSGSNESLEAFHQRLVRTNRMHLAYLFATGIKDETLRMKVLATLAENTVTTNDEVNTS